MLTLQHFGTRLVFVTLLPLLEASVALHLIRHIVIDIDIVVEIPLELVIFCNCIWFGQGG
jgi:hypothetical protein